MNNEIKITLTGQRAKDYIRLEPQIYNDKIYIKETVASVVIKENHPFYTSTDEFKIGIFTKDETVLMLKEMIKEQEKEIIRLSNDKFYVTPTKPTISFFEKIFG